MQLADERAGGGVGLEVAEAHRDDRAGIAWQRLRRGEDEIAVVVGGRLGDHDVRARGHRVRVLDVEGGLDRPELELPGAGRAASCDGKHGQRGGRRNAEVPVEEGEIGLEGGIPVRGQDHDRLAGAVQTRREVVRLGEVGSPEARGRPRPEDARPAGQARTRSGGRGGCQAKANRCHRDGDVPRLGDLHEHPLPLLYPQ